MERRRRRGRGGAAGEGLGREGARGLSTVIFDGLNDLTNIIAKFDVAEIDVFLATLNNGLDTYIHTYIFLRTLIAQGGGPSTGQRGGFFIACSQP